MYSVVTYRSCVQPHRCAAVLYDEDARGWQELTGSLARPPQTFRSERLAVAKRRA